MKALISGVLAGFAALATAQAAYADPFEINLFSGTSYSSDTASMDELLGITGYTIESFEDTALVPGLSISYTNPTTEPISVLPALYNEAQSGMYTNNLWDGRHALVNTPQNQEWEGVGLHFLADRTTFHIEGGATSFGIGLGNFQTNITYHELLVNGVSQVAAIDTLPGWRTGIHLRNGYIRIDAQPGEIINSVSFDIGSRRDGLIFDRLAFVPASEETHEATSVPEPMTGLAAMGITSLALLRKRKRHHRNL